MGLSNDPEKRARQLAGLAGGRGLSSDPEKAARQRAALDRGRAIRQERQHARKLEPIPAPPVPGSRVVDADYGGAPDDRPTEKTHEPQALDSTQTVADTAPAAADRSESERTAEPERARGGGFLGTLARITAE